MRRRLSPQARAVLDAVGDGAYGRQVIEATGLASGVVYQALRRLEAQGRLEAEWEEGDPSELCRPLRRYYRTVR